MVLNDLLETLYDNMNNTLKSVLKKAVITDLEKCDAIYVSYPSISDYFQKNYDTLKLLHDNNILTDQDIDSILEKKIISEAKIYVKMMQGYEKRYADHVLRTDFLAYAMHKNRLSQQELKKIRFDHDQGTVSYVERYTKPDLIENLRKDLLTPKQKVHIY